MFPDAESFYAALEIERKLALQQAERRARCSPRAQRRLPMRRIVVGCSLLIALAVPAFASAHPHTVITPAGTQVIANGQNHGPFVNGVTCGGEPAAYGLETAHHGPDAGTPGKADDCYQTTGGVPPGQDVANPVIR